MIPKKIYQTWKTKNIPLEIQEIRSKIQNLNPNYEMILFDDDDIDNWIRDNFKDEIIYNTYKQINVGAGKADFWRYLILYKNGGIYLDMDSSINKSLDLLIKAQDQAIISREHNTGLFVQWCLMFAPNHPILKRTINLCIQNINNKSSNNLSLLTGPAVFTMAVNQSLKMHHNINDKSNLCNTNDSILNNFFNNINKEVRCKFFGFDYGNFCEFKHKHHLLLYKNVIHWRDENVHNIFT